MAYSKRYAGGFQDGAAGGTPIDSAFLNAVEAALLKLLSADGNADGQALVWDAANTKFGPALLLNKNIDAAAAIAKSKLDFTGANGIVNADIAGAAAIDKSKINFGTGLVNADISTTAAIAISKLALGLAPATTLPGSPSDGQLAVLTDNATTPTWAWMLVWSASAAKWFFIGGSPAISRVPTAESSASSSYTDLTTVGPSFTAPRAGVYSVISAHSEAVNNTASQDSFIGIKQGSGPVVDLMRFANVTANIRVGIGGVLETIAVAAADVIKMQYKVSGGTGIWENRQMAITPVYLT